jgi:hypothetical protein
MKIEQFVAMLKKQGAKPKDIQRQVFISYKVDIDIAKINKIK